MKPELKNYGWVEPKIEKEQYVFGGVLQQEIVNPSGDWTSYLPEYEPQFGGSWDSAGCTVWGSENQIEIMMAKLFNEKNNFSERYIYNIVRIRPPGTDPQLTYEAIRKNGLIEDKELPMTYFWEDFITPDPMTQEYLDKGKKFLEQYEFKHDWLITGDPTNGVEKIREGLKYSPIAVSVTAWIKDDKGLYVDNNLPNTHWCVCFKVAGDTPIVFDSYDQSIKQLSPDHKIYFAKRIVLKKLSTPVKKNWLVDITERLYNFIKDLLK